MILKASQRGGGKQLALHLLNTEDNEHCEIHDLRGFAHDNLLGAMKEAYAVSKGTRCKQFLFSLSLNPPPEESVNVEVFEDALGRIEKKLGLSGQPRAVVFHEKEGPNGYRRHCHAVYSRIDADNMKAINLSLFKTKLQEISRELYLEHGWRMPKGIMQSKAADPRNYTLAEYQQAKRMGEDARDLKGMIQECWAISDTRTAFEHALSERGLILAKGDRRGHVAVTHDGEVLSLSRYAGKKPKEISAKLGKPDDSFPSVDEAKARLASDMVGAFNRLMEEAQKEHGRMEAVFDERRCKLMQLHSAERSRLNGLQKQRWDREVQERQDRLNKGLRGLWDRITGRQARVQEANLKEAYAALQRDRAQRDALVASHISERRDLEAERKQARTQRVELLWSLRDDRAKFNAVSRDGYRWERKQQAPQHRREGPEWEP